MLAAERPARYDEAPRERNIPLTSPRRTIHTQGDLDGACFLYAIANALTALTGNSPDLKAWGSCVRELPHVVNFIDGSVGTNGFYETAPGALVSAAERLLASASSTEFLVESDGEAQSLEVVAKMIGERSVAVLRYLGSSRRAKDVDHWVCAVAGADPPLRLHVACSIRWSDVYRFTDEEYEEEEVSFGRRSNDTLVEPQCKVVRGSVLRIIAV